jgi:hypothetical protein
VKQPTAFEVLAQWHCQVKQALLTIRSSRSPAARCRARSWLDTAVPQLAEALADLHGEPLQGGPPLEEEDIAHAV